MITATLIIPCVLIKGSVYLHHSLFLGICAPSTPDENIDIFNFSLSEEDMAAIATLDTGKSLFFDHHDAETTRLFMSWR